MRSAVRHLRTAEANHCLYFLGKLYTAVLVNAAERLKGGFLYKLAGSFGVQRQRTVTNTLGNGYGNDSLVKLLSTFAKPLIARKKRNRNAEILGCVAVYQKFAGGNAVYGIRGNAGGHCMCQGVTARIGGIVVAGKEHCIKILIYTHHHGKGIAAPRTDYLYLLRQSVGVYVTGTVVSILNKHLVCPCRKCTAASRRNLFGHLSAEVIAVCVANLGLLPINYTASTLDICADKYSFH